MDKTDDVVFVASTSTNSELMETLSGYQDKPLMMLFKRLIANDSKQNTVLTNAQIIDILQKEFHMDIFYLHELEIDVYLNILKKFLKDWPQWDEFDTAVNKLKSKKDYVSIRAMLESNYENLKEYLEKTLKAVEPVIKNTIKEVKTTAMNEHVMPEDDIVMQLQCSRQQLNQLFYRRPHPSYNMTIFNVEDSPSKIKLNTFSLETMLNWPGIRINLSLNGSLLLRREMILTLQHMLVNKKLNYIKKPPEDLNTNLQTKGSKLQSTSWSSIMSMLSLLEKSKYLTVEIQQTIQAVCDLLRSDLAGGPSILTCPSVYRRYLNKSPYVRYLYSDVNTDEQYNIYNYDIQLEETALPQFQINFSRFAKTNCVPSITGNFLTVDCLPCGVKFSGSLGSLMQQTMKEHFKEAHNDEQDWLCARCEQRFTMEQLTLMKWGHECTSEED